MSPLVPFGTPLRGSPLRGPRSRASSQRGSTAIEFALCFPAVLTIAAGIVDVSLYLSAAQKIERACRDGARVGAATVDGTDPVGDDIEAAALAHLKDVMEEVRLDPTLATTTVHWGQEGDGYCYLRVSIVYPFDAPFGLFPAVNDGVEAEFTMMTLQQL